MLFIKYLHFSKISLLGKLTDVNKITKPETLLTCTRQDQCRWQKVPRFVSENHDQFEAVQAVAQLLQVPDVGDSSESAKGTVQLETQVEVVQLEQ